MRGYIESIDNKRVLEIGGGNGNFSSLLYSCQNNLKIIIVDLAETLSHAIPFVVDLFPNAEIVLPNEVPETISDGFDFAFLTPNQIACIPDNFVDILVNFGSFNEMTHKQIDQYFSLIQRCSKNGAFFFTSNRVEKIPCGPDSYEKETSEVPNRFAEYPWYPDNTVLIYEICRLRRVVQLDDFYLRLERINKFPIPNKKQ